MIRLKVEDYYPQKKRWWLRLREKNCKANEMPCHYKLETYLHEYSQAAGIVEDRKEPLSAPLWDGRGRFPIAYCLYKRRSNNRPQSGA